MFEVDQQNNEGFPTDSYPQAGYPQAGYEEFDEADINQQLDSLLAEPQDTPSQATVGAPNENLEQFRSFIQEQREQRQLDRQRLDLETQRFQEDQRKQAEQLKTQNLQAETRTRVEQRFKPQFQQIAIDDATRETYKASDPYIRSIVENALKEQWENNIIPALAHYEYEVETLRSRPQATQALSTEDRVALIRPQVADIIKEQDFQRFLAEPVEGTGLTRREVMNFAYERGNVNSVVQQLDAYSSRKGGAKQTRTAQPTGGVHSAPTGGRGRNGRPRPISELNTAQNAYRTGRITLQKLQTIENLFEDLASKNMVDYNN